MLSKTTTTTTIFVIRDDKCSFVIYFHICNSSHFFVRTRKYLLQFKSMKEVTEEKKINLKKLDLVYKCDAVSLIMFTSRF